MPSAIAADRTSLRGVLPIHSESMLNLQRELARDRRLTTGSIGSAAATATVEEADPSDDDDEDEDSTDDDTSDDGDRDDAKEQDDRLNVAARMAASIGYDSNFDEENDGPGSVFHRYDASLDVSYQTDQLEAELASEATLIDLFDNGTFDRWAVSNSTSMTRKLDSGLSYSFGLNQEADALSGGAPTVNAGGFAEVKKKASFITASVRGSLDYEVDQAGSEEDDDSIAGGNSLTRDLELGLQLRPEAKVSPFLRLGISDVVFPERSGSVNSLNATGRYAVAGVTLKPNEKFAMDIGGRFERRSFADDAVEDVEISFADIRLTWSPVDELDLNAQVRRYLTTPDTSDATYAQITEYVFGLGWQVTERTNLELSALYEQTDEPEIDGDADELSLSFKASQQLTSTVDWFVAADQTWRRSREDGDIEDDYYRLEVRTGLAFKL
ncbi:MAG: outer membrane beta-barrel protein [Rhizobiaceae bacterium]